MQVIDSIDAVPPSLREGVVLLGNFDGVHRGHQAVIGRGADLARDDGPLVVVTFEPHPRSFFQPDLPPFRLTPARNKVHHIEALDVDGLVVLGFDRAFSSLTADAFVRRILVDGLAARHVVVGHDFAFGNKRGGTVETLKTMGAELGFDVTIVDPVASADDEVYSSTRIRDYLQAGKPGHAAALLGRPFEVEGAVQRGAQRGATIGFPTANLELGDYLRPAYGVYAVLAGIEGAEGEAWYDAIANVGRRPTVDGEHELLEVHIFDFDEALYDQVLRVALIEYIRPEQKFDGLDALKAQIEADCVTARRILHTRAAGAH